MSSESIEYDHLVLAGLREIQMKSVCRSEDDVGVGALGGDWIDQVFKVADAAAEVVLAYEAAESAGEADRWAAGRAAAQRCLAARIGPDCSEAVGQALWIAEWLVEDLQGGPSGPSPCVRTRKMNHRGIGLAGHFLAERDDA